MIADRRVFHLLLWVVIGTGCSAALSAQNIEAGVHGGYAFLHGSTILGNESGPEYGVWLNLWPLDRLAVSGDWSYIYRDDFRQTVGDFTYGELARNRQHVDLTLQYYFLHRHAWSAFGEIGGGFLYNNRDIVNPHNLPGFIESGKQSTRRGVFTVGGGIRRDLTKHVHWVGEVKVHNPGSSDAQTIRFVMGVAFSWR